jgi:hypothetical protein
VDQQDTNRRTPNFLETDLKRPTWRNMQCRETRWAAPIWRVELVGATGVREASLLLLSGG